jgi:hypothetical protein
MDVIHCCDYATGTDFTGLEEWDVGTEYAADALVQAGEAPECYVYKSLDDGNEGNEVTDTDWWECVADGYLTEDEGVTPSRPFKTIGCAQDGLGVGDTVAIGASSASTVLTIACTWTDGSDTLTAVGDLTTEFEVGDFLHKGAVCEPGAEECPYEVLSVVYEAPTTTIILAVPYKGTTETVATYKLGTTSLFCVAVSPNAAGATYSGGWNIADGSRSKATWLSWLGTEYSGSFGDFSVQTTGIIVSHLGGAKCRLSVDHCTFTVIGDNGAPTVSTITNCVLSGSTFVSMGIYAGTVTDCVVRGTGDLDGDPMVAFNGYYGDGFGGVIVTRLFAEVFAENAIAIQSVAGSLSDCTVNLGAASTARGIEMNGGSATGCVVNGAAGQGQTGFMLYGECALTDCEATCDLPFAAYEADRSTLANCVGNGLAHFVVFDVTHTNGIMFDDCVANGSGEGEGQTEYGFLLDGATNARLRNCAVNDCWGGMGFYLVSFANFAANTVFTNCLNDLSILDFEEDGSLAPVIAFMQFNGVDGDARTYTKYGSLRHNPEEGIDGGHALEFSPNYEGWAIESVGLEGDFFVCKPPAAGLDVTLSLWLRVSEGYTGEPAVRLAALVNEFQVGAVVDLSVGSSPGQLTTGYQEFQVVVPGASIPEAQAIIALRMKVSGTGSVYVGRFAATQEEAPS